MANSINTNAGALVALQNLNATNRALNTTQNRVNTGMTVATAKDNGAIFAIATRQRAEHGALDSVKQSIQRGQSVVDVALAAGDVVIKALEEQKQLAVAIQSSIAGSAQETAYLADFNALGNEITKALAGATFDNVNIFKEGSADNNLVVLTGTSGATTDSFTVHGATAAAGPATTVATATGSVVRAGATAALVDTAITAFTTKLATIGTNSKSLERQLTFVSKLQDTVETGIGNLVDADLAKESAKLTALQTKQQLGVQALSIANQASSIVLSLFRG